MTSLNQEVPHSFLTPPSSDNSHLFLSSADSVMVNVWSEGMTGFVYVYSSPACLCRSAVNRAVSCKRRDQGLWDEVLGLQGSAKKLPVAYLTLEVLVGGGRLPFSP